MGFVIKNVSDEAIALSETVSNAGAVNSGGSDCFVPTAVCLLKNRS